MNEQNINTTVVGKKSTEMIRVFISTPSWRVLGSIGNKCEKNLDLQWLFYPPI